MTAGCKQGQVGRTVLEGAKEGELESKEGEQRLTLGSQRAAVAGSDNPKVKGMSR